MATDAQIAANILNALKSSGPTSIQGKEASSQNATKHGLACSYNNCSFYLLPDEDPKAYEELKETLTNELKPTSEIEGMLIRRMCQSEWLRARALRLQQTCISHEHHVLATEHLALYLRYYNTHERAFYKAMNELQKLRRERRNAKIGFDSHQLKQAAAERAHQAMELKKHQFELQKIRVEMSLIARQAAPKEKKPVVIPKTDPQTAPDGGKIAA